MLDMETKRFPAGTKIFGEGDRGDMAFLVESGRVEISRQADDRKMVLGEIQAGGLFGEMALINDKPRMATATATKETACFLIPVEVFQEELGQANALLKALLLSFIQHVRHLTELLERAQDAQDTGDSNDDEVEFFMPDDSGAYRRVK